MDELEKYEKVKSSNTKFKLPDYIKPCISVLISEPCESSVNTKAFIIATDLRRIGETKDQATTKLFKWNNISFKSLPHRELERTIGSAYSKNYEYGCNKLAEYCLFREDKKQCPYYRELTKTYTSKNHERKFIKYGWLRVLRSPTDKLIYSIALPEVEKRRQLKPGARLYVTYSEIIEIIGVSSASVKPSLERLAEFGLIKLKIGVSRSWERKATEITRIIPIPKPKS